MHLASLPRLPAAACLATMSMLLSRPYLMLKRVDPECCSVPILLKNLQMLLDEGLWSLHLRLMLLPSQLDMFLWIIKL